MEQDFVTFTVDLADADRHGTISVSKLFSLGQKVRVQSFQSGWLRETMDETGGVVMVRAQYFRVLSQPGVENVEVKISQRVLDFGKSSFRLLIEFGKFPSEDLFAIGCLIGVLVRDGRAIPLPDSVMRRISRDISPASDMKGEFDAHILKATSEASQLCSTHVPESGILNQMHVLTRSSDEDLNHHVNHYRYAEILGDSLPNQELNSMYVEYVAQSKRHELCDVNAYLITASDERQLFSGESVAKVIMSRNSEIKCQAIVTWKTQRQKL